MPLTSGDLGRPRTYGNHRDLGLTGTQEYAEDGSYREKQEGGVEPQRLRFSYYTAGSGGVGPTILATSMLLAGEPVVAFKDGERVRPSSSLGSLQSLHARTCSS